MGITFTPPATQARLVRKTRGLTLDQVAAATGLTVSDLSRIERGLKHPTADAKRKLAAALDLASDQVMEAP